MTNGQETAAVRQARESARVDLLASGASRLPIDTADLCDRYGIAVELCGPSHISGICFIYAGLPIVVVAEQESEAHKRAICAHEFGRIMMGHVGEWKRAGENRYMSKETKERTATAYSGEIVTPECVLLALGVTTAAEIETLCGVDTSHAQRAIDRIRERRQAGVVLSPIEREICRQFAAYIQKNKKNPAALSVMENERRDLQHRKGA